MKVSPPPLFTSSARRLGGSENSRVGPKNSPEAPHIHALRGSFVRGSARRGRVGGTAPPPRAAGMRPAFIKRRGPRTPPYHRVPPPSPAIGRVSRPPDAARLDLDWAEARRRGRRRGAGLRGSRGGSGFKELTYCAISFG